LRYAEGIIKEALQSPKMTGKMRQKGYILTNSTSSIYYYHERCVQRNDNLLKQNQENKTLKSESNFNAEKHIFIHVLCAYFPLPCITMSTVCIRILKSSSKLMFSI
jgi:hypothetical protein